MRHMLILWLALAFAGMSAPIHAQTAASVPAITPEGFVTPGGAMSVPPRPSRPTVGLVLSGGGAKGIAHIGMIQALEDAGIPMISAEVTMIPQNYVTLTDETAVKNLQRTLELLEDDDDVQAVYHNWDE